MIRSSDLSCNHSETTNAELILVHVLAACNAVWTEGWDSINLTKKVIHKLGLVSMFLSDEVIIDLIDDYHPPRARYDMEDSHPIIFLFSRETNKTTIIFTCVQTSATIGGPESTNRLKGKIYIPVIHELVCFFLDILGAKNRKATIPCFTTGNVSIFRQALIRMELPRSRRIYVSMAYCQSQLNSCHQARPEVLVATKARFVASLTR